MSLPSVPTGQPTSAVVKRLMSPTDWRALQLKNLEATGESTYRQKIASPKKDPIDAGVKAQPKYVNEMKKDAVLARREAGLKATSMAEWYAYAQAIGAGRLVDGVKLREKEVADFLGAYQPMLGTLLADIDGKPVTTDKEREDKVLANLRGLKALHGTWKKA